jgi:ADP-dependent NAD(P)H-hydrate dehydratase / NAD(P)H-hydrate epimerase
MERTYWQKQTKDKPLFPDLLWSRPENKAHAGKLLVVGGNAMGFAAPAEAYAESERAGVGLTRVLLPLSVKSSLPKAVLEAEFAPNTPSGSFASTALGELIPASEWADAVLLAGDFGRNSETAVLLEKFTEKYSGQLTLCCDAVDYFLQNPTTVLDRPDTLLVTDLNQLQKLAISTKLPTAFTSNMDFLHIIDLLHEFSDLHAAHIILVHERSAFVASQSRVSTTQFEKLPSPTKAAAHASVWWLQNPAKPFEALTASIID